MDEEKVNLLVPEDGLIDNDVDKQYTEELDFSNIQEEIEKTKEETIKTVPLEPVYDNVAPEEPLYDDSLKVSEEPKEIVEEQTEQKSANNYNPGENPYAKVVLNKTEEVEEEQISHKDIKVDLKGNKALWFVVGIGLLLLIIIFLLPYLI